MRGRDLNVHVHVLPEHLVLHGCGCPAGPSLPCGPRCARYTRGSCVARETARARRSSLQRAAWASTCLGGVVADQRLQGQRELRRDFEGTVLNLQTGGRGLGFTRASMSHLSHLLHKGTKFVSLLQRLYPPRSKTKCASCTSTRSAAAPRAPPQPPQRAAAGTGAR